MKLEHETELNVRSYWKGRGLRPDVRVKEYLPSEDAPEIVDVYSCCEGYVLRSGDKQTGFYYEPVTHMAKVRYLDEVELGVFELSEKIVPLVYDPLGNKWEVVEACSRDNPVLLHVGPAKAREIASYDDPEGNFL